TGGLISDISTYLAAPQPAEPVKLECPKCNADRSKVPCAGELMNCHFKGEAQTVANIIPVVQEPAVPSDEESLGIAEDRLRVEDVPEYGSVVGGVINFARALLARYRQPAQPAAPYATVQSDAEVAEICRGMGANSFAEFFGKTATQSD